MLIYNLCMHFHSKFSCGHLNAYSLFTPRLPFLWWKFSSAAFPQPKGKDSCPATSEKPEIQSVRRPKNTREHLQGLYGKAWNGTCHFHSFSIVEMSSHGRNYLQGKLTKIRQLYVQLERRQQSLFHFQRSHFEQIQLLGTYIGTITTSVHLVCS